MSQLRQRLRDLPIRHKLALVSLATAGAALLIAGSLIVTTEYFNFRRALLEDVGVQAAMIGDAGSAALMFDDRKGARELLGTLSASPATLRAGLYDARGQLLGEYRRPGVAEPLPPSIGARPGHVFGAGHLDVYHPVVVAGQHAGTVYVRSDLAPLYARLGWHLLASAAAALVALLAAWLVLTRLQRAISRPIVGLAGLMRIVSEHKDYAQRAVVESRDEIGELAAGFNAMLTRIESHDRALTHELLERRRAEQRLDHLAHYDTVTHLPNRHFFNEKLRLAIAQALGSGRQAALLFIDLDNFKIINDTLGHQVGDRLLKGVAERLTGCLRGSDAICRVGGDEFAVVLEGIARQNDVTIVADKLIKAMARPFAIDKHEVFIGASIGVSVCPDDGTEGDTLLRAADTAMYYAKERGKNNFQYFQADMKGKVLKRLTMENHLRRALEHGEFELHYQPIYDLARGTMSSVEALVRWQHPELGMVSPGDFIPVAEETGLIVPLGEWVLRTACRQAKEWERSGRAIGVAVNISGRQFRSERLVDFVLEVLAETGLAPQRLTLELTESTLMDSSEATLARLERLKGAGIKLSIDDFGTGYSSMSYLKRFPIETLKIDRSFVRELPADADDVAITRSIIAMAASLNLNVVAEGVEKPEQVEFLSGFPEVAVQGYYFSRPVPAAGIDVLFEQERARERQLQAQTGTG